MKPLFIKKNGTVSKVSGIIMNLIPSYTLAEYNALTHKPLFWVRTDEEYAQIPSEDVSYGSGSVKDALDVLNADSGWLTTTAVNGNKMSYRKVGKVVYVARNAVGTIPANTATLVGTLPVGYRPSYYVYNGSPSAYIQIGTDGSINAFTPTANYMHPWYVSFIAEA